MRRAGAVLQGKAEAMTGDSYKITGDNNVMVVRSTVSDAFNKVKGEYAADTETFLHDVGEVVVASGDAGAAEHYAGMLESLKAGRPSMARTLWDGLVKILPDVGKVAGAATAIGKVFGA